MERQELRHSKTTHLAFIHIPRTGGSTFRRVLGENYRRIYDIDHLDIYGSLGGYDGSPIIWGHAGYGEFPNARHIVILRDPVERVASEYRYILGSEHPFREYVENMTLTEFAESRLGTAVDNQQVRLMCGTDISMLPYEFPGVPYGCINRRMLTQAKRNLRTCIFGIFEEYDNFMLRLREHFSWEEIDYPQLNGTEYEPVSPKERLAILRRNRYDMELYLYAAHRSHAGWPGA